jgi:glutaredoxin
MKFTKMHIGTGKGLLIIGAAIGIVAAVTLLAFALSPDPIESVPGISSAANRVVIFTIPQCSYCDAAKVFFTRHKIAFGEYDVSSSAKVRKAFQRMGGRGVPLILIGKARFTGFDEGALTTFLRKQGML